MQSVTACFLKLETMENKWISVKERLPEPNKDGKKVLVYRIMNQTQDSMPISVHDTNMVKHCNQNETWWQPLPEPPKTN